MVANLAYTNLQENLSLWFKTEIMTPSSWVWSLAAFFGNCLNVPIHRDDWGMLSLTDSTTELSSIEEIGVGIDGVSTIPPPS